MRTEMRMRDCDRSVAVPSTAQDSAFIAGLGVAAQQMDFVIHFSEQSLFPSRRQPKFLVLLPRFDGVEVAALEVQAQHPNHALQRTAGLRRGFNHGVLAQPSLSLGR